MTAMAAVTLGGVFMSCSHDLGEYNAAEVLQERYENAFIEVFGQPAANQDWGFGPVSNARTRGITRSQSSPECPDIVAPYDEAWVANYLTSAKEPNSTNVSHNNNNKTVEWCSFYPTSGGKLSELTNNYANAGTYESSPVSPEEKEWYTENILPLLEECSFNWNADSETAYAILMALKEYTGDYDYWNLTNVNLGGEKPDPDWVTEFKITGTYSGQISVAGSEGSSSPGAERTIVVTGTWNITENQRIGSLGKIIIADGGTVNVASGVTLNMVNEAQLVVLRGGKLTGAGSVEVNNGNAAGLENYNAGTIDVASFNNNFGKFYNYGDFLVNEYLAGATESNFYNHHLVAIDHTAGDANARVFNNCQFYVAGNARLRNYEGVGGSALIVGGQFMPFGSEDGTTIPSFVSLAAGALVKCGSLYNGASWTGPTSGYAALEVVNQFDYFTWVQDSPQTAGYFANNIYVKCGDWQNDPAGQGYHNDDPNDPYENGYNYKVSRAEYKFFHIAANCTGNGNVTKVEDSNNELLPADSNFSLGASGCTPGFKGTPTDTPEPPTTPSDDPDPTPDPTPEPEPEITFVADIRIIAEDLTWSEDVNGKAVETDFDFNDVVFDVMFNDDNTAYVQIIAAGGTLPLVVGGTNDTDGLGEGVEVHDAFGVQRNTMVNTNARTGRNISTLPKIFKVSGTSKADWGKNIPVYVQKSGTWIELTANQGEPAAKVGVAPGFDYCDERQSIKKKYPQFAEWVTNPEIQWY